MLFSKAFFTSHIFKQLVSSLVVACVLVLVSFYGLLHWQYKQTMHRHYLSSIDTVSQYIINQLNQNQALNPEEIRQLCLQNELYQIIIELPTSSQPIIIKPEAKNLTEVKFLALDLESKLRDEHYVEEGFLVAWRKLPDDHFLNFQYLIDKPNFWQAQQGANWQMLLAVPLLLVLFFVLLLLKRLGRSYDSWLSILNHTNNIDGSYLYEPLPANGSIDDKEFVGFVNLLNRLAYRFHKQQRVIEGLSRLSTHLVKKSPEAIFRLDLQGCFDFINDEFANAFALDDVQAAQLKLSDLIVCITQSDQALINELAYAPQQLRLEVKHKLLDRYYQLWLNPIYDSRSELLGFSGVLHNITQKQSSYNNLKSEQLKIDERIKATEKLWAVMGHELRTPLNGMIGTIALLEDTKLNDEQSDYLSILKTSSDAMLYLLNDMLDLSKMDAGKMQTVTTDVDLLKLCRDVCNLMHGNALNKQVELIFFAQPDAPRFVPGDAQRIRQVLLNLIGNAIKFTSEGHVALLVETTDKDNPDIQQRHIKSKENTQWMCFNIQDTGPGISEKEQKNLFMFFNQANATVSRRFGGTGLGLAISKGLSEMMGGFVTLKSTLGKGTTFKLYLPFEPDSKSIMYQYPHVPKDLYLMIFEPNPVNRQKLSELLDFIGLPTIMFDGLSEEHLSVMSSAHASSLIPLLIIDYTLLENSQFAHLLFKNRAFLMRNKLLMSQRAQRSIPSDISSIFDGYISKPIFVENFLAEVLRASDVQKSFEETHLTDDMFTSMLADIRRSRASQAPTSGIDLPNRYEANQTNAPETHNPAALAHDTLLMQQESSSKTKSTPDSKTQVILAEDNLVNQKVAEKMLQKQGFDVIIAKNGIEAVEKLQAHPSVKLVFMDCRMPKMDGLEATRKIREMKNSVPIIALTANDTEEDREACELAGMDEFLAKPINKAKLTDVINRYKPLF